MDMRKYEIYFECWPGYITSKQSERVRYPVLASVHFPVYYIKRYALFPYKNRVVNSNAFRDNRHMWDYHESHMWDYRFY